MKTELFRLALEVGTRLREPGSAEAVANLAAEQSTDSRRRPWIPESPSNGPVTLALFFDFMDRCRPGEGWDRDAHRELEVAIRGLEQSKRIELCSDGLVSGLAGLCLSVFTMSRGLMRYKRLIFQFRSCPIGKVGKAESLHWVK